MQVALDLSATERKRVAQNSIERVVNNAIRVGRLGEADFVDAAEREHAQILADDCEELKSVIVKIWLAVSNQIFEEAV